MPPLTLSFKPTVSRFIYQAVMGTTPEGTPADEVAAFGARGDGKTWGAFAAMIAHAKIHHQRGFPLPTRWLGAADTFASHTAKTIESLQAPEWQGRWRLRDQGHVAEFHDDGVPLVALRLFGVEDQSGMDRLRAECHGLWFEEPAPSSVMVQSSGLSDVAWGLGLTSRRLPTHHKPAIMTLNYPDEDHWTWQRFVVRRHPGTTYVRIPPGELASAAHREEWKRALANRPDMIRRLLEGRPGVIMLGAQVAEGFNEDLHAPQGTRVAPLPGEPVWIGLDGGLTPTSVIGQRQGQRIRVLGALATDHGGMRQHIDYLLRPWLSEHVPWSLTERDALRVCYDPSIDTDGAGDAAANALMIARSLLPGTYRPGPVEWKKAPSRREPLMDALNGLVEGQPILAIDPVQARGLVVALRGGWHYKAGPDGRYLRDLPVKNHPHSDYGDALCYLVADMLGRVRREPRQPGQQALSNLTPFMARRGLSGALAVRGGTERWR